MNPASDQQALDLLITEEGAQLEALEARVTEARLELSKLKLRFSIFGKGELDKKEQQLRADSIPKEIAKLEKKIARQKKRMDMLSVYTAKDQAK